MLPRAFTRVPRVRSNILGLLCCAATNALLAANHTVDSIAALKSKINEAIPGDTIILQNGAYTTNASITIRRPGTAEAPITIAAETVGGVEISGTQGFTIVEPASYIVIAGFTFTHTAGKNTIGAGTSQIRFTRNTFRCTGEGPYLSVSGDDAQIDYNEFADKQTMGSMIAVGGTGSQVARRLWIHHNYFHDFASVTTSAEMIRLGLSTNCLSTGAAIVEHNLFARCRGENELISSRSSGNTYRFNTLIDSPTAQLTLRHGNDCVVYGNTFRNTEGLRIFGDRHQVFSNYFEANYIGVMLGNGSVEVADGGALTGHDRPDDCAIVFNTFVENRTHYQMSRRAPDGLGATNTTFANNILVGGGVAAKIEGPNAGATWNGNLVWTKGGAGDLPLAGFAKDDPLLVADPNGTKRVAASGPAIDTAVGSFPFVTVDIDGQPRPEPRDKGADEFSSAPVVARVLSPADVGPNAAASAAETPRAP